MNRGSKWLVPATGLGLGLLVALADLVRNGSLVGSAASFSIIVAYVLAVTLLRSRSGTASLLSGIAIDERWESINQRAMAAAAQVIAVVTIGAFVVVELAGGDAMPFAGMAAVFAVAYLGSILWFRWRS